MAAPYRSTFSVVTTHLFTTGLAIPFVTGMVALGIIYFGRLQHPLMVLAIQCVAAIIGHIGGTYYSLSYLRSSARHKNWTKCTVPSILGFTTFAILAFVVQVAELAQRDVASIAILSVCYIAIWIAFARISAAGFSRMEKDTIEEPSDAVKPRRMSRLLGPVIGFVMGFVVGMAIAVSMDRAGWNPPTGWNTRLYTGLAVGGVSAFLGLFLKPSRI